MEVVLKRLLDAEQHAESLIAEAHERRDAILDRVQDEVAAIEAEFKSTGEQERSAELQRADARAEQAIAELERREEERLRHLRELAQRNEEAALSAALQLFLEGERG